MEIKKKTKPGLRGAFAVAMLFLIPGFFIWLFTNLKHEFNLLPYLGERIVDVNGDTTIALFPDETFVDATGEQFQLSDYRGKIVLVNAFNASCPSVCSVPAKQYKFFVYDKLYFRSEYQDVFFLTQIVGDESIEDTVSQKRVEALVEGVTDFDPDGIYSNEKWRFFHSTKTTLWSFELEGQNPLTTTMPNGKPLYHQLIYLIDWNGYLRGMYLGNETIETKRIINEMGLLKKEQRRILNQKYN